MRRIVLFLAVALAAALTIPLGCTTPASSAEPEGVELRSYQVPEGYESEVRSALRSALGANEQQVGRVSVGPGGQMIVVAPPGVQRGIAAFVKELEALGAPPDLPSGVSITYWLVLGWPADSDESGGAAGGDLKELSQALRRIQEAQGPTGFELLERLQLSSTGESHARASGRYANVTQRATPVNGEIVANIEVQLHFHNLSSQILLEPGQFLVLAQTGYDPKAPLPGAANGPDDVTLYYVIRSELEE